MKRLMAMMAVLTIGMVAGASLPGSVDAQGQPGAPAAGAPQGREGGARAGGEGNRGRGNAPDGRFTDEPRAARNMFLLRGTDETRAENGKVRLYTREQQNTFKSHFEWQPQYRLTSTTRPGAKPGEEPTHGELHTDNTQIYLITGGSGSVLVEGKVAPEHEYLVAPGEHRGGPITGGRVVKVKVGDLLSIPPYTWHIGYGDPNTPLQYVIIHVNTRNTIP